LTNQADDAELSGQFKSLFENLSANEQKIVDELAAVQGSPADPGGYYYPDPAKSETVMRPSQTFNDLLAAVN